jgi:2-hydroxy-6-oxonona-2,4-dienedioate hydrolase
MQFIALAVVVVTCGVFSLFARDMKRAHARISSLSQTLETSFGTIEYAKVGDGPPILVAHGSGGGFDQGLDMTIRAVDKGFQLIVPSRFGYLRSTMPAHASPAIQADAFEELLDRLGFQQVSVLAISAGAWSALEFAARHPNRCLALVLLVPAQALPPGVRNHGGPFVRALFHSDLLLWMAAKFMHLAPATIAPMMFGTPASVVRSSSAEEQRRLQQIFNHLLPISARSRGIELDVETAIAPQLVRLEKISCPVLAISAADDQFGTAARAESIIDAVSSGEAVIFSSGGHALVGRQSDVINQVASFLRGC